MYFKKVKESSLCLVRSYFYKKQNSKSWLLDTMINKNYYVKKFYSSLIKVLKHKNKNFVLHEPVLDNSDKLSVSRCLKSKMVSTAGSFTKKFEEELKKFTNSKYIVSVISGTSALHLSIIASGIKKNE